LIFNNDESYQMKIQINETLPLFEQVLDVLRVYMYLDDAADFSRIGMKRSRTFMYRAFAGQTKNHPRQHMPTCGITYCNVWMKLRIQTNVNV
jgi:hypothetical protein